ncbi:MAG TPA: hypothetical protein VKT18_00915, partial [Acidimicrobiales bacterium]|nr:hypothetical protein [Acidimicrobiales bacterium]
PTGTETTSASATTETFDTTMFSPAVGDIVSTLTLGEPGFGAYVLEPGQSITLPVDVAPTGAVGTQVQGTLYVDSLTWGANFVPTIAGSPPFEVNTLAAIPYDYTIGS